MLSVRQIASTCLGLRTSFRLRKDLFGRLGEFSQAVYLRRQLGDIRRHHCHFALPPKYIPPHPRLSPLPAIHFDHFNSSVTDMAAPTPGTVTAKLIQHGFPLGMCLNFLQDHDGNLYGFCGKGTARVAFHLTSFNDQLAKMDEYEITGFPFWDPLIGDLPLNLGYFVMDQRGRVIVVENHTDIVFLQKNAANKIESVRTWPMVDQLRRQLPEEIAEQTLAQVLPAYDRGYLIMALGDAGEDIPAYVGLISDSGRLQDIRVLRGETIANGMAVDQSGTYVLTDHKLYKFTQTSSGRLHVDWSHEYRRATAVKPGTEDLSKKGSGSTPTLLGEQNDLVAITDNADERIHLLVLDRRSGGMVCKEPLFKKGASANENSVVGYGDTIIVQNFYGAPAYNQDIWGLEPGLVRMDVKPDRSGCECVWSNDEFASTATVRLSTRSGLLYAPIQTSEDEDYAMAFIDFHTGNIVQKVPMGSGRAYRIGMSPAYFVPGGRLVQPVRRGVVIFRNI